MYFGHHYFVDAIAGVSLERFGNANCGSIIEMEKYPSRLAQYAQASLIRRRRRGAVLMGV